MVGQYLFKTSVGAAVHAVQGGHVDVIALATNYPLWLGFAFYGICTALLVLALRDGELGVLYPIISLTYIWAIVMGFFFFHEPLTVWKVAGVGLICVGVTLMGMAGKRSPQ